MKHSILGKITVTFSVDSYEENPKIALLKASYDIHQDIINNVEINVVNCLGKRTILKSLDWKINIDGVYDEFGKLVE